MSAALNDEALRRLPAPIVAKLQSLIARIRRVALWKGLWLTLATLAAALLGVMAVDAAFDLESTAVRCALSLSGLVAGLAVAWKHLVRPLSRRLTLAQVARLVEIHHPEMHERISTAVELLGSTDAQCLRGSAELLDEVVKSAVVDVETVSPEAEYSSQALVWPKRLAIAGGVALVAVLAMWPSQGPMLVARALLPFANIGSASAFELRVITQDAVVAEGEPLTIRVAAKGPAAKRVELRRMAVDAPESPPTIERLLPEISSQVEKGETGFALHIPAALDSFRYVVTAERARSREFQVTVLKRPEITGLRVTYTFPAYTGLAAKTDPDSTGDLIALAGTRVEVTAPLSRPAVSATIVYDQTEESGPAVELGTEGATPVLRWSATLTPGMNYRWTLHPKGERELLGKPRGGALRATQDLPPAVVIDSPLDRELTLRPNEQLPIIYTAADDFGFTAVDVPVNIDGRGETTISMPLPDRDPSASQTWHGTALLDLSKLPLAGVNQLRVRVRVADTLPPDLQGPQTATSDEILIRLNWGAESFARQTVDKQQQQLRRELEAIKNGLWDQRGQAEEKIHQLRNPDEMRAEQLQQLEKMTERATATAAQLAGLAKKAEKSAFAERAESIEHAATDMVRPAAESLQQIAQSDRPQDRSAAAEQARDQFDAAAKALDQILSHMGEDHQEAQQLAQLATLARQEQWLADQARAAAPPAPAPAADAPIQDLTSPQTEAPAAPTATKSPSPPAGEPAITQAPSPLSDPSLTAAQQREAFQKWQQQQSEVERGTQEFAQQLQQQHPPDRSSDLQRLASQAENLARQTEQLSHQQDAVEQQATGSAQRPGDAVQAAQLQADVTAKSESLADALHQLRQEAARTLEQNGTATTHAAEAATALEKATESGREATTALSKQSAAPVDAIPGDDSPPVPSATASSPPGSLPPPSGAEPSLPAALDHSVDPPPSPTGGNPEPSSAPQGAPAAASGEPPTPGQRAAAATGESLDAAAAALQEMARALAGQSDGLAAASQALAAASNQTKEASHAGAAAAQAAQQAAEQARTSGQGDQSKADQAESAARADAMARTAATPAQQAANNLSVAAAAAESAMGVPKDGLKSQNMGQHGSPKPGDGQSGQSQTAQNKNQASPQPGQEASDKQGLQTTKDYGLPPELARLGMSADDWSRLRSLVHSGADAAGGDQVPAEYRDLVKGYFRALATGAEPRSR